MQLYVTDQGTWGGRKSDMPRLCREDGSPQGGWKAVNVPTDKSNLIDFLNHNGVKQRAEKPKRTAEPKPVHNGSGRYRVKGGIREKVFISACRADSPEEACARVAETLVAFAPRA